MTAHAMPACVAADRAVTRSRAICTRALQTRVSHTHGELYDAALTARVRLHESGRLDARTVAALVSDCERATDALEKLLPAAEKKR